MKPKLICRLGLSSQAMLFILAPFLAMLPNQKAQAFCNQDTLGDIKECPNNTGGHKDITNNGLIFLRPTILDDIVDEHIFQDTVGNGLNPSVHFDNSNFTGGVNYINTQYGGVIAKFNPASPQPFNSTDEFGQLLHTAQDFYSHSNWVDYNPDSVPLFDSNTTLWTVPTPYTTIARGTGAGAINLLVIEGNPFPVSTTVVPAPSRIVNVAGHPSGVTQGLVSGFFSLNRFATPPSDAPIKHGSDTATDDLTTLNKDNSNRTNYTSAFNAAVTQTKNEWCRLLHLTAGSQGFVGSSIPMALWVDHNPNGNPHPTSTACSSDETGTQRVEVSINSIKVLNDTDPFGAGELNFPFVLYRKDFTKSVRTEVNSISVASRNSVPKTVLPAPLILDLKDPNDLVITLQSWDDDNISSSFDGVLDSSDDILKGITDFFPGLMTRKVKSQDLEVCLTVKLLPGAALKLINLDASNSSSSASSGCLDFGDAPNSYRTLAESNGPRYLDGELQRLGEGWDDEPDGQPTLLADGDDKGCGCNEGFTAVDDEDGVIFGDSWVDVIFNITRPDSNNYQLRAWWDANESGFFDHPTELFIDDLLTLEPGIFTKRYELGFDPKDFYSRFRLTYEPLDLDVKPFGEFVSADENSHGEVEDYAPELVPEPANGVVGLGLVSIMALGRLKKKKVVS